MQCIVTAGPTYEPLDKVRRLTNFSTGRLGSALSESLIARGHQVTLLLGEQATFRNPALASITEPFTTTTDLRERLRKRSSDAVGAVFHAAAVSDFTFGKVGLRADDGGLRPVKSGKISTREGTLLAELLPTPKLIGELRTWFPKAFLVGWKYEVDGARADVLARARSQITESRTDACVANGPAYGAGFGLVGRDGQCISLADQTALFEHILEKLNPSA
ncbi:MAG TPA: phosphopantothenoylcysteine decarboxylase [Verrucomicrobiae bacterium]|nr:phosphopantothenoylcysteine decarboxylase [Verrucomicrobiae bacterium]